MQLAYTLALLAVTATAIQVTTTAAVDTDSQVKYSHNNCDNDDLFEDCREEVFKGNIKTDYDYDACINAAEKEMTDACDDYDSACMTLAYTRYFDVWMDFTCLKDNSCGCDGDDD